MLTASTHTPSPIALIVDDQEWSSRSLESVLSINGYRIIRVGSIHAALEAAGHEQILHRENAALQHCAPEHGNSFPIPSTQRNSSCDSTRICRPDSL